MRRKDASHKTGSADKLLFSHTKWTNERKGKLNKNQLLRALAVLSFLELHCSVSSATLVIVSITVEETTGASFHASRRLPIYLFIFFFNAVPKLLIS